MTELEFQAYEFARRERYARLKSSGGRAHYIKLCDKKYPDGAKYAECGMLSGHNGECDLLAHLPGR